MHASTQKINTIKLANNEHTNERDAHTVTLKMDTINIQKTQHSHKTYSDTYMHTK